MKRAFYFVLWLLNMLLIVYGVIMMGIDLVNNAEVRLAVLMAFGLMGIFVALLIWPLSRRWAQEYPMPFYLFGGLMLLAGLAGMAWMMVHALAYSTLQIFGGWLLLMGGLMIFGLPWLLKKESMESQVS